MGSHVAEHSRASTHSTPSHDAGHSGHHHGHPPGFAGHPHRWRILAVLVLSLLIIMMDNTILNVALRTIADPDKGLGATQGDLEWIVNSYTLLFGGLLFTWGVFADRQGRKLILLVGFIGFGLSSLAATLVTTPTELIIVRGVMGVFGAAVLPSTLAIISTVFNAQERPKAIGIWSGSVGAGLAIGPILGGLLLDHFHWSSIFLVNVPICAAAFIACMFVVPESKNPHPGKFDPLGVLLSIVGLIVLCYGFIRAGEEGFRDPIAWAGIIGGIVVLVAFAFWERRAANPVLDIALFRNPSFSASIGAISIAFFALMGLTFFSAFYLQSVIGLTPFQAGLMLIPLAVGQIIAGPTSPIWVKRFGAKRVSAFGIFVLAIAMLGFAAFQVNSSLVIVGIDFAIIGFAMGLVMPPATTAILASVPPQKTGAGSAVSSVSRQVSAALGVAIIGSATAAVYKANILPALSAVPEQYRDRAAGSIEATLAFARMFNNSTVALEAKQAYVSAMHVGAVISTIVALIGVIAVLRWMPGKLSPKVTGESQPAPAEA
jgi:EmrB/QacA subfamily drug resistance transporter